MTRVIKRVVIVLLWIAVIAFFLYLPRIIKNVFGERRELHVYSFSNTISPDAIELFTQRTGIPVRVTTIQSNEQLLAKLSVTGGEGYDVIFASDYAIKTLCERKILQPLNHAKLSNLKDVDKRTLNHWYDPGNRYAIPVGWTPYGLAYNKEFFEGLIPDWDYIFDVPKVLREHSELKPFEIAITDDAREVIYFVAKYLFDDTTALFSKEQQGEILALLIKQKQWIEAYAGDKVDYVLSADITPIVISPASYMMRIFRETNKYGYANAFTGLNP